MPRGQKSKQRACEKRRQVRSGNKNLDGAQATTTEREESCSSSSSLFGCQPQNVSAAGTTNVPQGVPATVNTTVAILHTDSDEGTQSQDEKSSDSSQGTEGWRKDPINRKVVLLVQYLIDKYQKKEPISKADMIKSVIKKYKHNFNEIFKKASQHMELAFGVDLKEVDPIRHCYAFVNKLDHVIDGTMSEEDNIPKTGLLMIVLGVIFMNENCAPEEEVWEVLNIMGVYANKQHFIYGDPKKVITEDLVQLKYLEYRQVPDSDPPHYEFLWGSRAQAEISKMKILEFLAKIHDSTPNAFPYWYEEALKDEEERAQARVAARARTAAMASSQPTATSSSFSQAK